MKLFNTKSNQLEDFVPINPNRVMMYVCGPTVYNHAHIGNARPIVVFDTLKKTLEAKGYEVHYVSNFTDIDDKIIQKAFDETKNEQEIANRYIQAYREVRRALHAQEPDATPQVTQNIDAIIEFIQLLMDKGYAYQVGDNVYFRVTSVSDYGSLSHQNLEMLQA
ncbi:MAG: class I tRNA ligase family protein [Erysipelothrix sp.]|nr:class I tRNA ligase family protein [Erysipelothrix sp.]